MEKQAAEETAADKAWRCWWAALPPDVKPPPVERTFRAGWHAAMLHRMWSGHPPDDHKDSEGSFLQWAGLAIIFALGTALGAAVF